MVPFRYPEQRHARSQTPGPFADYHRYKPYLRAEFQRQCVYCRLPDGLQGADAFGVDHYRPRSRFPDLSTAYENLYYSCNACNRRKGKFWPTEEQWRLGVFLPNPCDHTMNEHLAYRGVQVEPRSRAGQLATEILMLNDEMAISYRAFVLRSIERCLAQAAVIAETLLELGSRLSTASGTGLEDLQRDLTQLKTDIARVAEDYELLTGSRMPGTEGGTPAQRMVPELPGLPAADVRRGRRREPAPGEERLNKVDGTVLLYVPGGEYLLGEANILGEPPYHVVLSPFWIGKYPVTNEQYGRFRRANPGVTKPEHWRNKQLNQPNQPVVSVTWDEAQAYCRWAGLSLPSEAQWEAAARGTDGRRYPWGKDEPTAEHANFDDREGCTTPVGAFPRGAGPFGTFDQSGNVWEWCVDVWDGEAYRGGERAKKDPVGTRGDDHLRCLRGGSWYDLASDLKAASRTGEQASFRNRCIGFRCLLPARPEP